MIFKTPTTAVKINGLRSLLLSDNVISVSSDRHNSYKQLIHVPYPEQAEYIFRGMLARVATDVIFYVDNDACFGVIKLPSTGHKESCSYVCYDGLLVRMDDADSICIDDDNPNMVHLSFSDGGAYNYEFATADDAVFAFNAMVGHIKQFGVLLLECSGDGELMAYKIS